MQGIYRLKGVSQYKRLATQPKAKERSLGLTASANQAAFAWKGRFDSEFPLLLTYLYLCLIELICLFLLALPFYFKNNFDQNSANLADFAPLYVFRQILVPFGISPCHYQCITEIVFFRRLFIHFLQSLRDIDFISLYPRVY